MNGNDGAPTPSADLRRDPLTGSTSLVVPRWGTAKAADPTPLALEMPIGSTPCPFCPSRLADPFHPSGVETSRAGGSADGGWSALALQNRWPHTAAPDAAEVVVLSSDHDAHLGMMSLDDASEAIGLMLDRAEGQRRAGRDPLLFVNHGVNAGSSQPHPHGQVIGLPMPDPLRLGEAAALVPGSCVLCERVEDERFIARLAGATVISPVAPAIDYEQLVVQTGHRPADARCLAEGIGTALRALGRVIGPVAYNLLIHVDAHPHVHVTPRTARHSGYGQAGIHTCYIDPAEANRRLARAVSEMDGADITVLGRGSSRVDAA